MKQSVIALAVLSTLSASALADITVTTGREGGSYFAVQGPKIVKYLTGVGLKSGFVSSSGSLDNLNKVAKGEAQVGIAQADALMYFKKTQPQLGLKIEIGTPLNQECVFIVAKNGGLINTDDDLQTKGVSIAAGAMGDGSRATWDYMGILEEKFKLPNIVDAGGASGLSQVVSGTVDAFIFVTNSQPAVLYSNELFNLARNNKNLHFVTVDDWDLNNKLPNGDSIYTFNKVVIKPGTFSDDKVNTICLNSYTVYNTDLDADTKEKLARVFLRMGASE
jgi:TRAP-type uncharacterized transport system substrate-binding protein